MVASCVGVADGVVISGVAVWVAAGVNVIVGSGVAVFWGGLIVFR